MMIRIYMVLHALFNGAIHSVSLWPYKAALIDITFYIFLYYDDDDEEEDHGEDYGEEEAR